jgi:hypothetical protein
VARSLAPSSEMARQANASVPAASVHLAHRLWRHPAGRSIVTSAAQLHAAPDADPLVAAARALYFSACGSAPVSSGPLGVLPMPRRLATIITAVVVLIAAGALSVSAWRLTVRPEDEDKKIPPALIWVLNVAPATLGTLLGRGRRGGPFIAAAFEWCEWCTSREHFIRYMKLAFPANVAAFSLIAVSVKTIARRLARMNRTPN